MDPSILNEARVILSSYFKAWKLGFYKNCFEFLKLHDIFYCTMTSYMSKYQKCDFSIHDSIKMDNSFTTYSFKSAGRIDSQEIMQSLRDLGVHISEEQAEKILKR